MKEVRSKLELSAGAECELCSGAKQRRMRVKNIGGGGGGAE